MAVQNINDENNNRYDARINQYSREANHARRAPEYLWIRLDTMKVDRSYQRSEIDAKIVNDIANRFDPWLFKPLTANRRDNGEVFIVDGQHRQAGRIAGGHGEDEAFVELHHNLSYMEEAELFYKLNTRAKPLTARQLFKGAVQAGDPEAVAIKRAVEAAGFRVDASDHNHTGGNITAVGALRQVWRQSKRGTLQAALQLIADTWGTRVGPEAALIRYMSWFVLHYSGIVDRDRFVKTLGKLDPTRLIKDAHEATKVSGFKREVQFNLMVVQEYNRNLKNPRNHIPNILQLEAKRESGDA